jgi:hypothetical protein
MVGASGDCAPVRRRTTLATIAAEAGVSLPTVSKVINGRPNVAPRARAQGDLIEDVPLRSNRVELATELIIRESAAPAEDAR